MEFTYRDYNPEEKRDKYELLDYSKKLYNKAFSYWKDIYNESKEDVEFYAGFQEESQRYNAENYGRYLEVFNILPQFINRVVGGQRMMTYSITVHSAGKVLGREEPYLILQNGVKLRLSEVLQDLIRGIEYQNNAVNHYKMAFKQALEGGFGWLRVYYEYDGDSFNLVPKIKAITDRWSVIVDPNVKEPDFSDMNYCFITEKVEREKFKKLYPDINIDGFSDEWVGDDYVVVAEFFERVSYDKYIYLLENGDVVDDIKDRKEKVIKKRKVRKYKVIWRKVSGNVVLEKEREFPTSTIPIVPVLGRVIYTDRKVLLRGLINQAKGSQKAINRILSSMLEVIDTQPISPFIASNKAIEGYEDIYANANKFIYSYLPYNEGATPPRREPPPITPAGHINTMNVLEHIVQSQTGIYAASLGAPSNEHTGVAIRSRQQEGDIGVYEFIDNYAMAIRRVGKLLIELIPRIYDTNRVVLLRSAEGQDRYLEINKVIINPVSGGVSYVNTLDWGEWFIDIEAGKNYSTKREESAEQISRLMQYSPQIAQLGADILVKNLDFAESDVLANRLKKTIPVEMLNDEERRKVYEDKIRLMQEQSMMQKMIPQQPNPDVMTEQMKLQQQQLKTEIEKLKLEQQQMRLQLEAYRGKARLAFDEAKRKNYLVDNVVNKINNEGVSPNG